MWAHADVLPPGPLRGSHPFPATAGSTRGWYVQGRVRPSGRGPGRCYLPTARGSILSGSSPTVKPRRLSQNLWRVSEQLKCKMISNQSNSWMGRQGAWPRPMGLGSAPPPSEAPAGRGNICRKQRWLSLCVGPHSTEDTLRCPRRWLQHPLPRSRSLHLLAGSSEAELHGLKVRDRRFEPGVHGKNCCK